jgi:hypothetical protein
VFGGRGNDTILGGNVAADEIHGGAGRPHRAFATSPESATPVTGCSATRAPIP